MILFMYLLFILLILSFILFILVFFKFSIMMSNSFSGILLKFFILCNASLIWGNFNKYSMLFSTSGLLLMIHFCFSFKKLFLNIFLFKLFHFHYLNQSYFFINFSISFFVISTLIMFFFSVIIFMK